jgi:hypothetical protein
MKGRLIFVVLILASVCTVAETKSKTKGKHERLVPVTSFDEGLRGVIDEKLLVTSANCGRMIRLQGGEEVGESAVSVYCDNPLAPNAVCHVTVTTALRNFDYVMTEHQDEADPLRFVREIPIVRSDAEIPRTTAVLFRSCVAAMMPKDGDPRQPRTVSDNDRIEFWLTESDATSRGGERGEQPGRRVTTLVRIGDLFGHYCEATPQERPAIAKKIEIEAAPLLTANKSKPEAKK